MTDLDCLRAAVRIYHAVQRVRPAVPSRVQRAANRYTPTEKRAAERGIELVEAALCRALATPPAGSPRSS